MDENGPLAVLAMLLSGLLRHQFYSVGRMSRSTGAKGQVAYAGPFRTYGKHALG